MSDPIGPTDSDAAPATVEDDESTTQDQVPMILARYGYIAVTALFCHSLSQPKSGTKVVLRTERGVELGEVVARLSEISNCCSSGTDEQKKPGACCEKQQSRGKVLRVANSQDLVDQRHLESSALEERKYCMREIKRLNLDMKVVTVEHLLGGERIIFYFMAEHRVDFRELVKLLAAEYRTRIEMRQVGARDEARLVGDYERCGRPCCCRTFLGELQPVSMRMAKMQKATLDPSKISGRCGRLMCCLRFEDEAYQELKKRLPHRNIWIRTADGTLGRVVSTQIITQLVELRLADNTRAVVANEDIVERDVPEPKPGETPDRSKGTTRLAQVLARREKEKVAQAPVPQKTGLDDVKLDPSWNAVLGGGEKDESKESTEQKDSQGQTGSAKPRRRRRSRKRPSNSASSDNSQKAEQPKQPSEQTAGKAEGQEGVKKKRKRRRRRKKPGSGDSPTQGGGEAKQD